MTVRLKFHCLYVDKACRSIQFVPVYSGSEENKKFFAATPGGQFSFYTVNEEALNSFAQGKEYYIDISLVE
jgi:hypothetical protein